MSEITDPAASAPHQGQRLAHFPITFFAVVMGLMGLSLALHGAQPVLPWAGALGEWVMYFASLVFLVIAGVYLLKGLRYPGAVQGEWNHPVRLAFFPAVTVSLLLTATAYYNVDPELARVLWILGTLGQGVLTIAVVSGWISHRSFEVGHLTPAWFIPAVGNVIVPVAGVRLGYIETSWLFFSAGLVFWIVLLTLVMNRLVFHNPIPARLFPTLVILIAPPAVAFIAYYQLAGQIDAFGHILLNAAYVFAALVLVQVPKLLRLPFALSWWALSFPVAALTIASFLYARVAQSQGHLIVGSVALAALCAIILGLLFRTLVAISRKQICQPE
ncbi:SLAC1 anion channel family protein [Pseudodonghicola flavimaris]|uniref:SLAC1 anion channel family protein n=1 Tax=Pseudodonghicola flavimaris TaxID=3050036 RepID=A0ABT7F768_9RHOB|nr:SLAC1 anion channel family protein [Pseudodonghicola flavimaris]MDK3020360.1 SLAC1 anion channel family protein [Pseudodonghicola flavimaris]